MSNKAKANSKKNMSFEAPALRFELQYKQSTNRKERSLILMKAYNDNDMWAINFMSSQWKREEEEGSDFDEDPEFPEYDPECSKVKINMNYEDSDSD